MKALLVAKNVRSLASISSYLKDQQIRVLYARSSEQAQELIARIEVALTVFNADINIQDALHICALIKSRYPDGKVIVVYKHPEEVLTISSSAQNGPDRIIPTTAPLKRKIEVVESILGPLILPHHDKRTAPGPPEIPSQTTDQERNLSLDSLDAAIARMVAKVEATQTRGHKEPEETEPSKETTKLLLKISPPSDTVSRDMDVDEPRGRGDSIQELGSLDLLEDNIDLELPGGHDADTRELHLDEDELAIDSERSDLHTFPNFIAEHGIPESFKINFEQLLREDQNLEEDIKLILRSKQESTDIALSGEVGLISGERFPPKQSPTAPQAKETPLVTTTEVPDMPGYPRAQNSSQDYIIAPAESRSGEMPGLPTLEATPRSLKNKVEAPDDKPSPAPPLQKEQPSASAVNLMELFNFREKKQYHSIRSKEALEEAQAHRLFQRGKNFLRKQNPVKAYDCFKRALEKNLTNSEFRVFMAWAFYLTRKLRKNPSLVTDFARQVIQDALHSDDAIAWGHLFLGMIALDQAEMEKSIFHLKKARENALQDDDLVEQILKLQTPKS